MSHIFIKFNGITFQYAAASQNLFENLTLHFACGWSGVVGANGSGKSTLLKLATGIFEPSSGVIDRPDRVVYCPQRTDDPPERLGLFIQSHAKTALILKSRLGVEEDWETRWSTLSHGERKRAQIAVALWREPDVLAVDEPTNHLDAQARDMLKNALEAFTGVGLLVSHDRELLDSLCDQCCFIDPPHVTTRKGGYSAGNRVAEEEQKALAKQRAIKKQSYKKLKREIGKRRERANKADKLKSKRNIARKDHDAKEKIGTAIVTGKDGVAGKLLHQLDGHLARAQKDLDSAVVKKDNVMGIWLPGSISRRSRLLELDEGSFPLGGSKQTHHPMLYIKPDDRIGITGPNGSGKSTLLNKILPLLNVEPDHTTYVPQEISAAQSRDILAQAKRYTDEQKGYLMMIVSRLGSRPERLLESATPSPGEARKLLLAMGMTREPHIIIMDEPTNHMDLPSIECLEKALSDCPCAMVLISHDKRFLSALTHQRWRIHKESEDRFSLMISG